MHWLEIKKREQFIAKDNEFLLRVPVLPNKYLYEKRGYTLALYKSDENKETFYLQTDHADFYDTYKGYYAGRFHTTELEDNFEPPQDFSVFLGAVNHKLHSKED